MSKSDPGTLGFWAFGAYTFGTLTLGTLGTFTEPALAWPAPMKTAQRAAETVTSFLALISSLRLQPPACTSLKNRDATFCRCCQGPKEAVVLADVLYHSDL